MSVNDVIILLNFRIGGVVTSLVLPALRPLRSRDVEAVGHGSVIIWGKPT